MALAEAPPVFYGATRDTPYIPQQPAQAPEAPLYDPTMGDPTGGLGGYLPFASTFDPTQSIEGYAANNTGSFMQPVGPSAPVNGPGISPMVPGIDAPSMSQPSPYDAINAPYPTARPYITDMPAPVAIPTRRDIPQYDSAEEARRVKSVTGNRWLQAAAIGLGLLGGPQGLRLGAGLLPAAGEGAQEGARAALGADYNRSLQQYTAGTQEDQQQYQDAERARQEQVGNIESSNQITGVQNRADIEKWQQEAGNAFRQRQQDLQDAQAKTNEQWRTAGLAIRQQTLEQKAATAKLSLLKPLLKTGELTAEGEKAIAETLRQAGGMENLPDDFLNSMTPQQREALTQVAANRESRVSIADANREAANMRNQERISAAADRQKSMQTFSQKLKATGAGPGSQLFNAWKSMEVNLRAEDNRINSLRQSQAHIDSAITGIKKSPTFANSKMPNGVNQAGQDEIDRLMEQRKLYDGMIDQHQGSYENMASQADALLSTPGLAAVGGAMQQGTANYQQGLPPGAPGSPRPDPTNPNAVGGIPPPSAPAGYEYAISPTTGHYGLRKIAAGSVGPVAVAPGVNGAATKLPEGTYHDKGLGVTVKITRKKK